MVSVNALVFSLLAASTAVQAAVQCFTSQGYTAAQAETCLEDLREEGDNDFQINNKGESFDSVSLCQKPGVYVDARPQKAAEISSSYRDVADTLEEIIKECKDGDNAAGYSYVHGNGDLTIALNNVTEPAS